MRVGVLLVAQDKVPLREYSCPFLTWAFVCCLYLSPMRAAEVLPAKAPARVPGVTAAVEGGRFPNEMLLRGLNGLVLRLVPLQAENGPEPKLRHFALINNHNDTNPSEEEVLRKEWLLSAQTAQG